MAGGRALATPTRLALFYSPNITARPKNAVSALDRRAFLLQALREGCGPTTNYFPVVPIPASPASPTAMPWRSRLYVFSSASPSAPGEPAHDVPFPFAFGASCNRLEAVGLHPGSCQPALDRSVVYNSRSLYLVTALAHCASAILHAISSAPRIGTAAGRPDGPPTSSRSPLTPETADTGRQLGKRMIVVELLRTGTTPELRRVKGAMREPSTCLKYLSDIDLEALPILPFVRPPPAS